MKWEIEDGWIIATWEMKGKDHTWCLYAPMPKEQLEAMQEDGVEIGELVSSNQVNGSDVLQ